MEAYEIPSKPYLKVRIFATLIDYLIYFLIFFIYTYSLGQETEPGKWTVTGLTALPIFLFWFIYFVGLEALNQSTPGHDTFQLKVVRLNGERITLTDVFKRRICDILDFGLYGIPAIICILKTEKHQRIGDLFANTIVIKRPAITQIDYNHT